MKKVTVRSTSMNNMKNLKSQYFQLTFSKEKTVVKHYGRKVVYLLKDDERSRDSIIFHLNGGDWTIIEEVIETNRRTWDGLKDALSIAKANFADLIMDDFVIVSGNFKAITMMLESQVKIIGVDLKPNFPSATNQTFLRGMRMIAEQKLMEQSNRIKRGQKRAVEKGVKIGNTKHTKKLTKAHEANVRRWAEFRKEVWPIIEKIKLKTPNVTEFGICQELEMRGILTFKGKTRWYPQVLRRIINQNLGEKDDK